MSETRAKSQWLIRNPARMVNGKLTGPDSDKKAMRADEGRKRSPATGKFCSQRVSPSKKGAPAYLKFIRKRIAHLLTVISPPKGVVNKGQIFNV